MSCASYPLSTLDLAPASVVANGPRWYAVYTYPRHERSVLDHFESKDLEAFLPTFVTESRWKDRRVRLQTPVFPGYVFTRIHAGQRIKVLSSPGVIRILCFNGMPAAIDDAEIEAVKLCLERGTVSGPYPLLEVGDRVRVRSGVLEGLEGYISRCKNDRRLIVPITLINQSVAIEVDVPLLELVDAKASATGSNRGNATQLRGQNHRLYRA